MFTVAGPSEPMEIGEPSAAALPLYDHLVNSDYPPPPHPPVIGSLELYNSSSRYKKRWNNYELSHLEWVIWWVKRMDDCCSEDTVEKFATWYEANGFGEFLEKLRRPPSAIAHKAAGVIKKRKRAAKRR